MLVTYDPTTHDSEIVAVKAVPLSTRKMGLPVYLFK